MSIVRLCYHGSSETFREAATNNEESISEQLVQATGGERKNTRPPENKKQGKWAKARRTNATPHRKKKEKSPTPKREEEKQRKSKRKKKEGVKRKEKKKRKKK